MQADYLLFAIIWIVFYAYWIVSAWRTRSPVKRRASRSTFLLYGVVWVVIWIAAMNLFLPDFLAERIVPAGIGFTLIGLLIALAGIAFAVWARVHLGKNWSGMPTIREQHSLTRTGPYRYVRHPIYSGITLGLLGTAIGLGYVIVFSCVILIFILFVIKSHVEEKFLTDEFGEEYARYRREVKALIPYVF